MERSAYQDLVKWRARAGRKPLVLRGARQVGKTWLLSEFGRKEFRRAHWLNLERAGPAQAIFRRGLPPNSLIEALEVVLDSDIDPDQDVLIIDEIQQEPQALAYLKYFREDVPRLAVCCAGSHIGLQVSEASFPVGQVDFMTLHPLTFVEFLLAHNPRAAAFLEGASREAPLPDAIHETLWHELKLYWVTGGLPEAVSAFLERGADSLSAMRAARDVQSALVEGYRSDFAKHSGKQNAGHISRVFSSIPEQIARVTDGSVAKYRFKGVIPNRSKFAQFDGPIDWLVRAGLAIKTSIVETPSLPLRAQRKANTFKLYLLDVGLLGCLLDLPFASIINQDYGTFKGYVAENFVAQELSCLGTAELYSWTGRAAEIEFVRQIGADIVPVEVKSGIRTRARSLSAYSAKYHPPWKIKLSARNLSIGKDGTLNLPLYLAGSVDDLRPRAS